MIIQIDGDIKNEANLIAARDQKMLKRPGENRVQEMCSNFSDLSPIKDQTVTLIGHTNDSKQTVGEQTAKQIAENLAERYQNNKANLKEVFLIACESGMESDEPGWLWGNNKKVSFAQQLANELQQLGFNDAVKVYAARPTEEVPEPHAIRVAINTSGLGMGGVRAIAYMNKETTDYHENKGLGGMPPNYEKKEIMKMKEDHHSTFRSSFTPYTAQTKSSTLSSAPDTSVQNNTVKLDESHYRDKLLEKDGIIMRIINAILGRDIHTHLAKQLQTIKEEEQPALDTLQKIKDQIKPQVDLDVRSVTNKMTAVAQTTSSYFINKLNPWRSTDSNQNVSTTNSNTMLNDFQTYLNINNEASWQDKQTAWNVVKKHDNELKQHKSYKDTYTALTQCHEKIERIHAKADTIKAELNTIIDNYLTKNQDKTSDIHAAKKEVMTAVKTYLNNPTEDNWNSIQTKTKLQSNTGWNKGFFSQVRDIHQKIEIFEEQIRPKP